MKFNHYDADKSKPFFRYVLNIHNEEQLNLVYVDGCDNYNINFFMQHKEL